MARLFKKKTGIKGLSSGSLSSSTKDIPDKVRLSIVEYTEEKFIEKDNVSIWECLEHISTPAMTWIQVYGVSDPTMIVPIGKHFKLHSLVIEDIVNPGQRSKLDIYEIKCSLLSVSCNTKLSIRI